MPTTLLSLLVLAVIVQSVGFAAKTTVRRNDYWSALDIRTAAERDSRSLALLRWSQGNTEEASQLLTNEWNKLKDKNESEFETVASELSGLYLVQGNFEHAIDCYRTLQAVDEARHGHDSEEVAKDLNNIGVVQYILGTSTIDQRKAKSYLDQAQFNFNRSIKVLKAIGKEKSPSVQSVWINQSFLLRDLI